jgi:hypothetical protein
MRYSILISIFLFATFISCKKDKFTETPTLKFESVNTRELHSGQLLQFTLSFTDAEGDLTDSLYVEEISPDCGLSSFFDEYHLPTFPTSKNQQGNIVVTYGYNAGSEYTNISPKCQKNDTATFRFALRDKAKHVSDTVSSPPIVIYYQ